MIGRYGQILKFVPLLTIADIATTDAFTAPLALANAHRATLLLPFGAITGSSTTAPIVTLLAATGAATTGATAITFNYRKSSAVGTDSWGDVTAATTSGVTMGLTDDNKVLMIDVDPSVVRGANSDKDCTYVIAKIDTAATISACVVGCIAEVEPRYAQNSMVSAS